jgi:hypothetical protein
MEEMQEALRGKNRTRRLNAVDCMPNDADYSYSSDSLDDRALRDESSTVISEFSSTRTLMNIGDDIKPPFDEDEAASEKYLLFRKDSDSKANNTTIQYPWQINAFYEEQASITSDLMMQIKKKEQRKNIDPKYISHMISSENRTDTLVESIASNMEKCDFAFEKTGITSSISNLKDISTSILNIENTKIKSEEHKQGMMKTLEQSPVKSTDRRNFIEFPPTRHEKKIQEYSQSVVKEIVSPNRLNSPFYLPSNEEKSETKRMSGQNNPDIKIYETIPEELVVKSVYDYKRKYHTYPKSRIPISKYSRERHYENYIMDPRMFPLEPREIDLESFQQLHIADSQEELQEFLLLESQCSGNLGLAGNVFASEISCDGYRMEDERGTMSGRILLKTNI